MYSKPLYNLFLIFFLAAVTFIYFNRAFMILCAHRAQLCGKIRLFCYISLFLRNYLFRMRLFVAGPGGWVGALWEGWQVCGARFPFFCGASLFFMRESSFLFRYKWQAQKASLCRA